MSSASTFEAALFFFVELLILFVLVSTGTNPCFAKSTEKHELFTHRETIQVAAGTTDLQKTVSEGELRPAADMQADVQRLRLAIVEAVEL